MTFQLKKSKCIGCININFKKYEMEDVKVY